jgi:hypothetical protein
VTRPRLIDFWIPAKSDLGIDISGPLELQISDDLKIHIDVLVREFGFRNGTVLVEDLEPLLPHIDKISSAGYSISVMLAPRNPVPYDRSAMIECLRDWEWNGPSYLRPKWLGGR